jgi:hypothetical protein
VFVVDPVHRLRLLAGLNAMPDDVFEAARVDGAGRADLPAHHAAAAAPGDAWSPAC